MGDDGEHQLEVLVIQRLFVEVSFELDRGENKDELFHSGKWWSVGVSDDKLFYRLVNMKPF